MAVEFSTENYDPDKMDGFDFPEVGQYHAEVSHVDEDGGKNGEMVVDFEILAGTTANQEGKSQREYFSKTAAAEKRMLQFACATGLTTVEELKAKKEKGENPVIDFNMARGRQLCIGIEAETYEDKTRNKVGFRMWHVDSDKAKGIPLNKGKLAQQGDAGEDPFADSDVF